MISKNQKLNFKQERLGKSGLLTKPGDVFTIIIEEGVISNSITFELTNKAEGEEFFSHAFPNKLPVWEFLKKLNEVGNRTVLVYNEREDATVPFDQSAPYIYRFGGKAVVS